MTEYKGVTTPGPFGYVPEQLEGCTLKSSLSDVIEAGIAALKKNNESIKRAKRLAETVELQRAEIQDLRAALRVASAAEPTEW